MASWFPMTPLLCSSAWWAITGKGLRVSCGMPAGQGSASVVLRGPPPPPLPLTAPRTPHPTAAPTPNPQVFCLVCPLIAPVALAYFAVALCVQKYHLLYVWSAQYQSGGKVRSH